jgi:hypothetical protein
MAKPIPSNQGAKAREQARQAAVWVPPPSPPVPPPLAHIDGGEPGGRSPRLVLAIALTLLLLGFLAVILITVLVHLSTTSPPAASLLPEALRGQGGYGGLSSEWTVFL